MTDKLNKSSKPLGKNLPAVIIGLALIMGGVTVYVLLQTDTSQTELFWLWRSRYQARLWLYCGNQNRSSENFNIVDMALLSFFPSPRS